MCDRLTLNQGIASLVPDGSKEYGDLVGFVDEALYRAKNAGRNTIATI